MFKKSIWLLCHLVIDISVAIVMAIIICITPFPFIGLAIIAILSLYIFIITFCKFFRYHTIAIIPLLLILFVFVAAKWPKYDQQVVGPFTSGSISLQELNQRKVIRVFALDIFRDPILIKLTEKYYLRSEVIGEVEKQLGIDVTHGYRCSYGYTILYGYDSRPFFNAREIFNDKDYDIVTEGDETFVVKRNR